MSKVLLYIAQTLDGYIADENKELTFLDAYNDYSSVGESFLAIDHRVSVEIMGRKTYDWMIQHGGNFSENHEIYVITHHDIDNPHVKSYSGDLNKLVKTLKQTHEKDIWLVGGGELIKSFIELDLIDEYQIAVLPVLIGKGTRLFQDTTVNRRVKLTKSELLNDIVLLTYVST